MSAPELSAEQTKALDTLLRWWRHEPEQFVTLGGYAGTGKTTLLGVVRRALSECRPGLRVSFCCYTGRASRVLASKLAEAGAVLEDDFCGTIHQLIYNPIFDDSGRVIDWVKVEDVESDLIVVDEASMVNEEIWRDLLSYGVRIIAAGDHGQLPPIEGKLNLMASPQIRLEEIHRQEAGNPIIALSMMARKDGRIPVGRYGDNVVKMDRRLDETAETVNGMFARYDSDTMVICGLNRTRVELNRRIRSMLGFKKEEPLPGERVICLKNNWMSKECVVLNGMLGTIRTIKKARKKGKWHWYRTVIDMDGEEKPYRGRILRYQFDSPQTLVSAEGVHYRERGDLFDRGYALTVHKAQGGQAKKVILFEEPSRLWQGEMWRRWIYTAVTRASEELLIVGR